MSLFGRIWSFVSRRGGYVGKDLRGNFFYEYANPNGSGRTRRVVKYQGKADTMEAINNSRQLAVQWKAWLTHTRSDPPTIEELQADIKRQLQIQKNVALIEERERAERLRVAIASEAVHAIDSPDPSTFYSPDIRSPFKGKPTNQQKTHSVVEEKSPWVPRPTSEEPQSWTPRAARRGT